MPTNVRYQITRVIAPAADTGLVTLDRVKAALGIDPADTSKDAQLASHIAAVSQAISNYCGRIFVVQTYRDNLRYVNNWLHPGEPLRTRQFPILVDDEGLPVVAIVEDGATVTAWDVSPDEGALYRLDSGGGIAGWTGKAILIYYAAGYDPIPDDVQAAALDWVTARWHSEGRDPSLRSETVPDLLEQTYVGIDPRAQTNTGGGSTSSGVPVTVRALLAPYMWPAL